MLLNSSGKFITGIIGRNGKKPMIPVNQYCGFNFFNFDAEKWPHALNKGSSCV